MGKGATNYSVMPSYFLKGSSSYSLSMGTEKGPAYSGAGKASGLAGLASTGYAAASSSAGTGASCGGCGGK